VSSPDGASPAAARPRRYAASLYLLQNYGAEDPVGSGPSSSRRSWRAPRELARAIVRMMHIKQTQNDNLTSEQVYL
jgi:hypothetical protein